MANSKIEEMEAKRAKASAEAVENLPETIEDVTSSVEGEMDYVTGFLKAASWKQDVEKTKKIEVKRNGVLLFAFSVRPISDDELMKAKKYATTYAPNPAGKKYPRIEKEFNAPLGNSYLIYMATVDEDKQKYWDNQELRAAVEKQNGITIDNGVDLVNEVFATGEKEAIIDVIDELSEGDIEASAVDVAKN